MYVSTSGRRAGKFNRGSNAGTARCTECGRLRQKANIAAVTGFDGSGTCNECFEKAGDANSVADGAMTEAEFVERYGEPSGY